MKRRVLSLLVLLAVPFPPAISQDRAPAPISRDDVLAAERALAGPEMRGRGSGTADEARAADWVAAQFKAAGLKPAPGMDGYLQTAPLIRRTVTGEPTLTIDGVAAPNVSVVSTGGGTVGGAAAVFDRTDGDIPTADVLVFAPGAREVSEIARRVRDAAGGFDVRELHGQIPAAEQDAVIRGRRGTATPIRSR